MNIDFNKLIHSATYYLSYQDRIGRDFMIDESSLKYPIADYLTGLEMPLSKIKLEYSHPDLEKRQIDLVTIDSSIKEIGNAFEFKLSRQNTRYKAEQKRIFNDLMRLYLLGKSTGSSNYFLIAGTQNDFIQYFRSIVTKRPTITSNKNNNLPMPRGFYTEWFNFKVGDSKTFNVKTTNESYKEIYNTFLQDYKAKTKLELPDKITTKCIAISALSREFPTPYVGGVWKIE